MSTYIEVSAVLHKVVVQNGGSLNLDRTDGVDGVCTTHSADRSVGETDVFDLSISNKNHHQLHGYINYGVQSLRDKAL